jgi:hypothetical protein
MSAFWARFYCEQNEFISGIDTSMLALFPRRSRPLQDGQVGRDRVRARRGAVFRHQLSVRLGLL